MFVVEDIHKGDMTFLLDTSYTPAFIEASVIGGSVGSRGTVRVAH
jgi:hypothetical protein